MSTSAAPQPERAVIRQDYILDLVRQLAQFLARALALQRAGSQEEARAALDAAAAQLAGLSLDLALRMPAPALLDLLRTADGLDAGRAMVLGALLARRAALDGDPAAREKALALLAAAEEASGPLPLEIQAVLRDR